MISNSLSETKIIAKKFASTLRRGDIVLLYGELGAGKTAFTKGVAEYFKIEKDMTSPTFTLMNVYDIAMASRINPTETPNQVRDDRATYLIHIDTYRLKNSQELIDIGVEDYLGDPDTICIIEWPEKIADLLKDKKTTAVKIADLGDGKREIVIE